jgi:Domain of unknown function (DUF4915)
MNLLVSFCNVRTPGLPSLALVDPHSGAASLLDLPAEPAWSTGMTGLALSASYLFAVQQITPSATGTATPGPPALLIFDRSDLSLLTRYVFPSAADVHSLLLEEERLYAVSTGTDELLEIELRGANVVAERVLWRPDPAGPRSDVHHLNALCRYRGELLICGFGKKAGDRWGMALDGFVTSATSGQTLASGIQQPHSVLPLGDRLLCCESRTRSLRTLPAGPTQTLPGYTRGLAYGSSRLYVATSRGRRVSKSIGLLNNPAESGVAEGSCTLSRLTLESLTVEATVDLSAFADEIYDVLPVEDTEKWPRLSPVETLRRARAGIEQHLVGIAERDATIMSLTAMVAEQTAWAQRAVADVVARDATVRELQAQLADARAVPPARTPPS